MVERTLIVLKPDCVWKYLVGRAILMLEERGLKVIGMKMTKATEMQLQRHFPSHDRDWIKNMGRHTIEDLIAKGELPQEELKNSELALEYGQKILQLNYEYLSMGPIIPMVVEGENAIAIARELIGNTIPEKAKPGTFRHDFGDGKPGIVEPCFNLIHASKDEKEAEIEIDNFFCKSEIFSW